MSLSAVWTAQPSLLAPHRQWAQRLGGQRSKFCSWWIASILTSPLWGLTTSTMNPTQSFIHWIAITLPSHITTSRAASSLWRLVPSVMQEPPLTLLKNPLNLRTWSLRIRTGKIPKQTQLKVSFCLCRGKIWIWQSISTRCRPWSGRGCVQWRHWPTTTCTVNLLFSSHQSMPTANRKGWTICLNSQ